MKQSFNPVQLCADITSIAALTERLVRFAWPVQAPGPSWGKPHGPNNRQ